MQIAHKIELNPNNKQKTYFLKACGISRFAWNWGLSEWKKQYVDGKKPNGLVLKKEFNAIKTHDFPWTKEVTKYAAQQPFLELQKAFQKFFKKQSQYPKFKKKGKTRDSFYIGGDQIKIQNKKIWIPNLGFVQLKEPLRFVGKINSVVISKTVDKWFVSVQIEAEDISFKISNKNIMVGVDIGLNKMAVTSDGYAFEAPKPLKKHLKKLKRQQRILSKKIEVVKNEKRKISESKNCQKQIKKVQKTHYKVSCIRKDTLQKLTTFLASNYTEIAIENLNVKGMVKNHNLARHIHDVGFGEFRRQLEYKMNWRKTNLVIVDRFFPSSKMCSNCGFIKDKLSLSERIFICDCGNILDRDLNAAINLKNKIGKVLAEYTPVEITALQKSVHPIFVTSIDESGNKHQAG